MAWDDSDGTGTATAVDPEEELRRRLAVMPPAGFLTPPAPTSSVDALARNPQNLLMPPAPMPDRPAKQGVSSVPRGAEMPPVPMPSNVSAAQAAPQTLSMPPAGQPLKPAGSSRGLYGDPSGHYEGDVWHPDLKQRGGAGTPAASGANPDFVRSAMQAASAGPNTPRNYAQDYDAMLKQEPNRADFPAAKMPFWKKALAMAAAGAAGYGRKDDTAYELARRALNSPQAAADEKYNQAHQQWEGQLKGIEDQAKIAHLQPPQSPEEHAKLADLYADAVKNAVAAGKNPLEDPDVKKYGDAIQNLQREPAQRTQAETDNTPFKLWRQQHPNADVKEYFKLQPEARNETRPPKDTARLTPGQKASITSRYKQSLSDIEDEFQSRQSGSYVDKRSGELLPPMTQAELNRKKQQAENNYKDELEAAGEPNVTRFNYSTGRNDSEGAQPQGAAPERGSKQSPSPTNKHQVGDVVTYQGKQHRITAIHNGKADLVLVGPGQ